MLLCENQAPSHMFLLASSLIWEEQLCDEHQGLRLCMSWNASPPLLYHIIPLVNYMYYNSQVSQVLHLKQWKLGVQYLIYLNYGTFIFVLLF